MLYVSLFKRFCLLSDCVCVCVYTLPPVGFFRLHDVFDIREKFGSTIFCCEYQLTALCQVPSSPYLKMSYFTSKKPPAALLLETERYDIMLREKMIYIDIGNKSARTQPRSYQKILKIRRLL